MPISTWANTSSAEALDHFVSNRHRRLDQRRETNSTNALLRESVRVSNGEANGLGMLVANPFRVGVLARINGGTIILVKFPTVGVFGVGAKAL